MSDDLLNPVPPPGPLLYGTPPPILLDDMIALQEQVMESVLYKAYTPKVEGALRLCIRCGSLVGSEKKHSKWHRELRKTLKKLKAEATKWDSSADGLDYDV